MSNLECHKQNVLRQCQLKELSILRIVADICDKNDIDYWLDGGSLLGAVRHGGFIPWDDDIDIAMLKEDAERFVKIAPSVLPDGLFLQTPGTDKIDVPIIKIRDLNSFFIERGDDIMTDYAKGIYIDIFPFEAYPSVSSKCVKMFARGMSVAAGVIGQKRKITFGNIVENVYFRFKYLSLKLAWRALMKLKSTDRYIGNVSPTNGYGIAHLKGSVFPLSTVEFEGLTFKAPHNPNAYLTDLYGDYMKLPPEEQREAHAPVSKLELKNEGL